MYFINPYITQHYLCMLKGNCAALPNQTDRQYFYKIQKILKIQKLIQTFTNVHR